MPRFTIIVPASCNQAFLSQIAAMHRTLFSLRWTRWVPSLHVIFGGPIDAVALEYWRPHLERATLTFIAPHDFSTKGIWAQADAELTAAPRDADVVIAMDADTLLVRPIESLLDQVLAEKAVAGCMAHYRIPETHDEPERTLWARLSAGLTNAPLDFSYRYSMNPDTDLAPFYLNFGAVYFEGNALQRILRYFVSFRMALAERMPNPIFSAQAALTLAAAEAGVKQIALQHRYNFPNDPVSAHLYPEELEQVAVFHYLRTNDIDRAEIFSSAPAYQNFMTKDLSGVNLAFRNITRGLLGAAYPFNSTQGTQAPSTNIQQKIATLDIAIQSSPFAQASTLRLMRDILSTGLFDPSYYLTQNPHLSDPLRHYVETGDTAGLRPNAFFDPEHYRRQCQSGVQPSNALLHYAQHGEAEGVEASAEFSAREYCAANLDIPEISAAPLRHWITKGQSAGLTNQLPGAQSFRRWRDVHVRALDELMTFRKALVEKFGVERAFRAYAVMLALPSGARVVRRKLAAQLDTARQRGMTFNLVKAGGVPFRLPLAEVIGPGPLDPVEGYSRSLYLACLPESRVRGASSIIVQDETAMIDTEGAEFTSMDVDYTFDAAVFHADTAAGCLWMIEGDRIETRHLDEAFCLLGARSIAFGHWMWEQLPKYSQARLAGLHPNVPVLIESGLPLAHRQSLETLYPGIQLIEVDPFETLHVRRLWLASTLHFAPLFEKRTTKFSWAKWAAPISHAEAPLADLGARAEHLVSHVPHDGKIYLARRPGTHRLLVNHTEIEEMVAARGYRVVYPETLSFSEQIHLIRGARTVAAADGSAAFLMLLARPGTRLCLLTSAYTEPHGFFTGLLAAARTDMIIVSGPIVTPHTDWPEWADYRIDPAVMATILDRMEQNPTAHPHLISDGA